MEKSSAQMLFAKITGVETVLDDWDNRTAREEFYADLPDLILLAHEYGMRKAGRRMWIDIRATCRRKKTRLCKSGRVVLLKC